MTENRGLPASPATGMLSHAVRRPEDQVSPFPSGTSAPCPLDYRQEVLRAGCKRIPFPIVSTLPALLIGGRQRLLQCSIYKAGVGSSTAYYGELNTNPKYHNRTAFWSSDSNGNVRFLLPELLRSELTSTGIDLSQFNHIRWLPIKHVTSRFGEYRKILLVRHPLQRLVSAYYQRVVLYNRSTPFHHFVRLQVLPPGGDAHWADYHTACAYCDLKYDYILKLENVNAHLPLVNREVGIDPNYRFPVAHVNPNIKPHSNNKYTDILKTLETEHPTLFQGVLKKYQTDMELFGYTWDGHVSGCRYKTRACC